MLKSQMYKTEKTSVIAVTLKKEKSAADLSSKRH